jgi:hypothetical protein
VSEGRLKISVTCEGAGRKLGMERERRGECGNRDSDVKRAVNIGGDTGRRGV